MMLRVLLYKDGDVVVCRTSQFGVHASAKRGRRDGLYLAQQNLEAVAIGNGHKLIFGLFHHDGRQSSLPLIVVPAHFRDK